MRPIPLLLAGLILIPMALPASAQQPPAAGPTLGTPVQTAEPVALPPDKQDMIRKHAARSDLPTAELAEPARVGMIIPSEVSLLTLPQDSETDTPTVTRYSYVIAGDVIAVVDPENRTVIQLIKR